jgi:signal transduction histidine kinase
MRKRLLFGFVGITLSVFLIQAIPLANYFSEVEKDRIVKTLQRDAFIIAAKAEETLENPNTTNFEYVTKIVSLYRNEGGARIVVTNKAGVAVATSDEDEGSIGSSYLSRPEVSTALSGSIAIGERFSNSLGYELLFVAVPVFQSNNIVGSVRVTFPTSVITAEVDEKVRGIAWIALVTVLATAFLALVLSRELTRNLTKLKSSVEKFASGDLTHRADISGGDAETRELSNAFDQMAQKIENLIEEQRGFAADASHQLRTPLTALNLRLEQAQNELPLEPEMARQHVTASLRETERLGRIIEGLLAMSRFESQNVEHSVYFLPTFIQERIEMWSALLEELDVRLVLEEIPKVEILGMLGGLEQVFDNIVDNALKFSKSGDEIRVSIDSTDEYVQIRVSDQGPGMSDIEREQAFEKFWTSDSSRISTGLGLAIAKKIMNASRGEIFLEESVSGGVTAVMQIPRKL